MGFDHVDRQFATPDRIVRLECLDCGSTRDVAPRDRGDDSGETIPLCPICAAVFKQYCDELHDYS